jgi:outer membrane protein assembly factor BamA
LKSLASFFLIILFGFSFAQEKTIASLEFKGAIKTKSSFLKKIIEVKHKDILDSVKLDKDIIRLKRLPAISHAYYQVFLTNDKKQYNVFYTVEENFTVIPNLNIWTSTNNQFSYKIGLYDFNFLGRGVAFGGFYQNNGEDTYSINFRAPYLFNKKMGLAINHQNWKSEEPLYFENQSANYLYNNISLEVLGLYELNTAHKFNLGINIFNEKYQYVSGDVPLKVPRFLDLDKILLKLLYDYDKLDYSYQYVSGFRSLLTLQSVSSNDESQDDFFIGWNDLLYFKRVSSNGNWASRLRLGLATNSESPFAPFALDNNLNIRGVGNLIDRGTGVILLNTEYRHTVYEKDWFSLQGNVFIDSGSWRKPGGDLDDFISSENIKIYPGLGLRLIHKKMYNAIFRIDYGLGITKDSSKGIVFGIGQYF